MLPNGQLACGHQRLAARHASNVITENMCRYRRDTIEAVETGLSGGAKTDLAHTQLMLKKLIPAVMNMQACHASRAQDQG